MQFAHLKNGRTLMPAFRATLSYPDTLVRQAFETFRDRVIRRSLTVVILGVAAMLDQMLFYGGSSRTLALLGTALALGMAIVGSIRCARYRNALHALQKATTPYATLTADDSNFTVRTRAGDSIVPWSAVREISTFHKLWILRLSWSKYVTLPLDCIESTLQQFIVERVRAAGGNYARKPA